jgi:uncharacterized membrane protein
LSVLLTQTESQTQKVICPQKFGLKSQTHVSSLIASIWANKILIAELFLSIEQFLQFLMLCFCSAFAFYVLCGEPTFIKFGVFISESLHLSYFFPFIVVLGGVHCSIYKGSFNVSTMSYLNSLPLLLSFIPPPLFIE